jgi:hypothetical protein
MEVHCLPADADHQRLTDAPKESAKRLMPAQSAARPKDHAAALARRSRYLRVGFRTLATRHVRRTFVSRGRPDPMPILTYSLATHLFTNR